MNAFTEGLWHDLAGSNIHAAIVNPGPIDTRRNPMLVTARFLRLFLPALPRFGMAKADPVPPQVVSKARARAAQGKRLGET